MHMNVTVCEELMLFYSISYHTRRINNDIISCPERIICAFKQ